MRAKHPDALFLHPLPKYPFDDGLRGKQDEGVLGVSFEDIEVGKVYEVVAVPDPSGAGFIAACDNLVRASWGNLVKCL